MSPPAAAVVNGRGARRARRGHPWVFRDDVVEADAGAGDLVQVLDRGGSFCCWATFSPGPRIALRRVSTGLAAPGPEFWSAALARALALRGDRAGAGPHCARLIHADADGFPGLTVDRYGAHLVYQATTAWADRAAPDLLRQVAGRTGARTVLARNDAAARTLEGLALDVFPVEGRTPDEIEVQEAGLRRFVDPWRGHKTGLHLDQQANHRQAPGWLAGRLLDVFSGEGGFALPLAAASSTVVAVDQASALVDRARRSAEALGVDRRVTFRVENAFDVLSELDRSGARFDGVILDPPPFARRRREIDGALRGYKDLHRRALRLLGPGGRLLSFSCSFAIDAGQFEAAAREGAEEAGATVRVLGRPGPSPDHPEQLLLPESRYLKGLLLEREGG